jgi:hypothetical protein
MRLILGLLVLAPAVIAQREEAEVEWQKRHARISYGVVGVGRHKLDALQIGGDWRMGRNEASTLESEMALIVGDQIVVPGSYRAKVGRQGEREFSLQIDGGAAGEAPSSTSPVHAKAELVKPDKPSKTLEIGFKADGKSNGTVQPAKVAITFGDNRVVADLSLVGTKSQKAGGFTVDAFLLPADLVEKRVADGKATPVLALKKETGKKKPQFHVWNLVVSKDSAELWPAPTAPTESYGFGDVKALDATTMVKATSVAWADATDAKPALEITKVEGGKGKGLTLVLHAGKRTCTIAIPEPKTPQ